MLLFYKTHSCDAPVKSYYFIETPLRRLNILCNYAENSSELPESFITRAIARLCKSLQIYSMKFQRAASAGPWRFMHVQYGVILGLWDSKPILFYFGFIYTCFYYFFNQKACLLRSNLYIYSPEHGLVSCSLILAVASMIVEVDPIDPHGLWSWPMQYVWTSYLNEYSKYLGSELV